MAKNYFNVFNKRSTGGDPNYLRSLRGVFTKYCPKSQLVWMLEAPKDLNPKHWIRWINEGSDICYGPPKIREEFYEFVVRTINQRIAIEEQQAQARMRVRATPSRLHEAITA